MSDAKTGARSALLAIPLVGGVLSCGPGDVEPPVVSIELEDVPWLEAVEELRIGNRDDPALGFTSIGDVAVTDDGVVIVVERAARELRVYDSAGGYLRTIGRSGEGPGEFRSMFELGARNDSLWVTDPFNQRLTLFTLEGEVLRTVPASGAVVASGGESLRLLPTEPIGRGRFAGSSFASSAAHTPEDSLRVPGLVFDESGEVVDTSGTRFRPPRSAGTIVGGFGLAAPRTFAEWPLQFRAGPGEWEVLRQAAPSSGKNHFTLRRRDEEGRSELVVNYVPTAVSENDVLEAILAANEGAPVEPDAIRREMVPTLSIPAYHPPVVEHLAGSDGSVWLRLGGPLSEPAVWLILATNGQPIGRVRLSRSVAVKAATANAIWVVADDEVDVPWLIRLRIQ